MTSTIFLLAHVIAAAAAAPLEPFQPDNHTRLLYHFDEGQGAAAKDASPHGNDGEVRGAAWTEGRFGKALSFDGQNSVFRQATPSLDGLRQLTVECWFKQDNPEGRQFLAGKDVAFHFDLGDGAGSSLSLYNQGGAVANAEGLRHQQVGVGLGDVRPGRWHHLAGTYDGARVSFFLDGVLKGRRPAPRDFLLGVPSRGLWIGCYVGQDYWFQGKIDEFRVSDCVRYDAEGTLKEGQKAFEVPRSTLPARAVRPAKTRGRATLRLTLKRTYGPDASGWVLLKTADSPAVVVGKYALAGMADGAQAQLELDVSDEAAHEGSCLLALEETGAGGYFAVTSAELRAGEKVLASWKGEVPSRRTFHPPLLIALREEKGAGGPMLLVPERADRTSGSLELEPAAPGEAAYVLGEGEVEHWFNVPQPQTYRVDLRYAAVAPRPCDLVIDGRDLHPFHMAARHRTGGPAPRSAFWECQGTVALPAGPHWLRLEGSLPEIIGVRLTPIPPIQAATVPWQRDPSPAGDFLARAETWTLAESDGSVQDAVVTLDRAAGSLSWSAVMANRDPRQLWAADRVRWIHQGTWDLEPFGQLRFDFEGQGSGHLIALWAVDVKGDQKLLWRMRDARPGRQSLRVPLSFEGNEVFDPAHVRAIALEVDEGNVRAEQLNKMAGRILAPVFDRRDEIQPPAGYQAALEAARKRILEAVRSDEPNEPLVSPGFRPWTKPVMPEEHPLFDKADPKPVTRKTLGYDLHCTGARSIEPRTLDDFHKAYDFGDVCWPHIGICPQRGNYPTQEAYRAALAEMEKRLVDVRERGLLLFDIWGYVPLDPNFPARVAPEHHEILLRVFGDRFLGYDNGEQDGRYIGSYAGQGKHTNRREGWDDFVRWDERIAGDHLHYMNATGSLNFSHYYGQRQCRLLGLETAQGLPSDTLMFAFLRGAGKEYGRLLTQATSIWNRFGYAMYHARRTEGAGGYGLGPNKGCSLSLHRRLFFSSYLGGHSIVGTEAAQFTADRLPGNRPELSPLGRQHLELREWFRKHPDRGVMYTPVALMLDFYHGWNMPRHLYRGDRYKIWGKFPYEKGDYLVDGLFRMIWPGYEDTSYLRNERGFLTPTPFGDSFDVLTNRCHPSVLNQYTAIMLLGDVEMTPELVRNLVDFVRRGGDLLLDVQHARSLPAGLAGVGFGRPAKACASRIAGTREVFDEEPYSCTELELGSAKAILLNERGQAILTVNRVEKGRVIVAAVDHWMSDAIRYRRPEIVNMEPPYLLLRGLKAVLARYFDSFSPVEVSPPGLGVTTCCYADDRKRLLVGLVNQDLFADWQGTLRVRHGAPSLAREIWKGSDLPPAQSIRLAVPAGDVRLLDLRLP